MQSTTTGSSLSPLTISTTQNPPFSRPRRSRQSNSLQNDEHSPNAGGQNGSGDELSSIGWFASSNSSIAHPDDQMKTRTDFGPDIGFKNFDLFPPSASDLEYHFPGGELTNRVEGTFHLTTAKPSTIQVFFSRFLNQKLI